MNALGKLRMEFNRLIRQEDGPTATEYAILLAMLIIVAMAAIQGIGSRMMNIYTNIDDSMPI